MKIAFVVSQFPVLSESFVVQQVIDLLDSGHDVRIFASSHPNQKEIQKEVEEYDLLSRTTYIVLPRRKWLLRLKGILWSLTCFFYSPAATMRMLRDYHKRKDFSYYDIYLLFVTLKNNIDIIHAHFGPNGNRSLCVKKAGLKTKLLTTFHGYDVTVYTRQHGEDVYQSLFRYGDLFTYNSEATKQKLLALGCPENKMVKLPMGIDLEKIPFKERNYKAGETIHLLSVGRLVEMKGREYAIKAVADLKGKYPIQYDILGDGSLRMDLQKLIDDLEINEMVRLWGWVDTKVWAEMYRKAHLFIHPSVTSSNGNQEGQGVVLLEAQAHGLPVIATRHGAFPDSVRDGLTAFLVPERDTCALAAAIEKLIQDAGKWPQIGRRGRVFVEEHFDSKRLNERLVEIYKQILNSHT